ncbi:MAG: nucleoside kinase [Clostridiales bacterium]|nr:nucleoside kinase [Clostridiales bacterium]
MSAANNTIEITLSGKTEAFPASTTPLTAIGRLSPAHSDSALCVMCGGDSLSLNEPLQKSCVLRPLSYRNEEGRRVYERSLRFLLLLAMRRLFPEKRIRILNSVGYGVYLRVIDEEMDFQMVQALEAEMHALVDEDIPFEKEIWTTKQAIEHFQEFPDKAEILKYRPSETIPMYRLKDLYEYFYGITVPSTRYVKVFALRPHYPGLVVCMPEPKDPSVPAPYLPRRKHLRTFTESQEWSRILGVSNIADVNRMIEEKRMREFIRVNEALQDKSIAAIADQIVEGGTQIVLVFGPSSSGKTTFAHRLAVHLRVFGRHPHILSLDNFYRPRGQAPKDADGRPDLEHIDALDIPLLLDTIEKLLSGEAVRLPAFDFHTGKRGESGGLMQLLDHGPLIMEGIHALNDQVTAQLPEQLVFGIYVSALHCVNLDNHNRIRTTDVRLLRRIVRDAARRGIGAEGTIAMWPSVRAGEERWIFPNQEKADVMFNTSLQYELPVLKTTGWELLSAIPETSPAHLTAHRILKFLQYFLPASEDVLKEIPPQSILREFIGGSSFDG